LIAGVAGAIGAFGTLLAFGAKGNPAVVMTIVFGGAPVVNAAVALYLYRDEINFSNINPLFYVGLLLAVVGGGLTTKFKPNPAPKKPAASVPGVQKAASAPVGAKSV
jgi:drug/metabolite transporter (DMT)-like permease